MNTDVLYGAATAIHRRKESRPLRHWRERGLLRGEVLDYGAGHDLHEFARFDPFHAPDYRLLKRRWDTVLCSYVLNVQPADHLILEVLLAIRGLLTPAGWALIAVRNDLLADAQSARGVQRAKSRAEWQALIAEVFPAVMPEKTSEFHGFVAIGLG